MNRLLLLASGGTPGGGGEEEGAYREDSLKVAKCTFGTDIRKFGRLGFVDARESIDASLILVGRLRAAKILQ
jgi:hypothetical protein